MAVTSVDERVMKKETKKRILSTHALLTKAVLLLIETDYNAQGDELYDLTKRSKRDEELILIFRMLLPIE